MSRSGRQPHHTCPLPANGRVAVVGESHYQSVLRVAANQMPANGDRAGFLPAVAVLIPEPENHRDSNAVRVDLLVGRRHHTVGYLSRANAPRYQPALLALFVRGMVGSCPAEITGGGDGRNYAVALRLGPSTSLPPNVADDPLTIPIQVPRSAPVSPTPPRGRRAEHRLPPVASPRTAAVTGVGRPSHRKPLWIGAGIVGAVLLIAGISFRDDSTPIAASPAATTAPSPASVAESVPPPPAVTQEQVAPAPVTPRSALVTPRSPATPPAAPVAPAAKCDSNYSGACVPIARDVDCTPGSGNGPAYVRGPVRVVGSDIYGLDSDNDGVECE